MIKDYQVLVKVLSPMDLQNTACIQGKMGAGAINQCEIQSVVHRTIPDLTAKLTL
jgi:hypothetical protein